MIHDTLNWYSGEIFEGKFILGFGVFTILVGLAFYFWGSSPAPKALLIPMLVLGAIFITIGGSGLYQNTKKIGSIEQVYKENPQEFQQNEIKRVEGFMYLYPMSVTISLVCFLGAVALLYFVKNIHWQAVAMALILFGGAFAVIDYFSKERALMYYEKLQQTTP